MSVDDLREVLLLLVAAFDSCCIVILSLYVMYWLFIKIGGKP